MAKYLQDIRQGDTRTIKINYGEGFDISGWTFYFVMKEDLTAEEPDVLITTTVGDHTEDDAANGIVNIVVSSAITGALTASSYYYSVKRSDGGATPDIKTILPPVDEYKDRLRIIPALKLI